MCYIPDITMYGRQLPDTYGPPEYVEICECCKKDLQEDDINKVEVAPSDENLNQKSSTIIVCDSCKKLLIEGNYQGLDAI